MRSTPRAAQPACIGSRRRGGWSRRCRRCSRAERPRGRRVAVVGDGGGYGAVACDLLGAHDLELPVLSRRRAGRRCARSLPPTAATANPVDLAGAGEQDAFSFARTTRTLLESGDVDAVLFTAYFGGYSSLSDELRDRELAVAAELAAAAHETGRAARRAHDVLGRAAGAGAARGGDRGLPRDRVGGRRGRGARRRRASRRRRSPRCRRPPPSRSPATAYADARAALAAAGVPFGAARTVVDARRGGGGRRGARLSGRVEGARRAAQVRRGRRRRSVSRDEAALRRRGRPARRARRTRSRRSRTRRPGSSCWSARAGTRASAPSSSSARAACTRSSSATPPSALAPVDAAAAEALAASPRVRAAARRRPRPPGRSTCAPRRRPSPRCRASPPRIRSSRSSR